MKMGLIRNHYVGRTFIEPQQSIRHFSVKVKLNPVRSILEGRRVDPVGRLDRSRTTSRKIVKMVQGGRRARGAPAHQLSADHLTLLLRCGHAEPVRADCCDSLRSRTSEVHRGGQPRVSQPRWPEARRPAETEFLLHVLLHGCSIRSRFHATSRRTPARVEGGRLTVVTVAAVGSVVSVVSVVSTMRASGAAALLLMAVVALSAQQSVSAPPPTRLLPRRLQRRRMRARSSRRRSLPRRSRSSGPWISPNAWRPRGPHAVRSPRSQFPRSSRRSKRTRTRMRRFRALVLLSGFNDPRTRDIMRGALGLQNDRLRAVALHSLRAQCGSDRHPQAARGGSCGIVRVRAACADALARGVRLRPEGSRNDGRARDEGAGVLPEAR